MSPREAPDSTIAVSGKFVTTASATRPPIASPQPSRNERMSVVWETLTPASQTAAAEAMKITSRARMPRDDMAATLDPQVTALANAQPLASGCLNLWWWRDDDDTCIIWRIVSSEFGSPLDQDWFRTPPRAHGELVPHRTVSFVELFYDLVYVVLIAQIAHNFAAHITWTGVWHFAVVFALVGIGWLNGSTYHNLHGREDGRSRSYIFAQMTVLALMAAYSAHALDPGSRDGLWFSVLYAVLLILLSHQWWTVRRYDEAETDRRTITRWVFGHLVIAAGVLAGGLIGGPARA